MERVGYNGGACRSSCRLDSSVITVVGSPRGVSMSQQCVADSELPFGDIYESKGCLQPREESNAAIY